MQPTVSLDQYKIRPGAYVRSSSHERDLISDLYFLLGCLSFVLFLPGDLWPINDWNWDLKRVCDRHDHCVIGSILPL